MNLYQIVILVLFGLVLFYGWKLDRANDRIAELLRRNPTPPTE